MEIHELVIEMKQLERRLTLYEEKSGPHHKHVPPNIKQHRVPAPEMSFTRPNLPVLNVK